MKNTHTLTDNDFQQLIDTAALAQTHHISINHDTITLTDLEDPEAVTTTTRADVQRIYTTMLEGHPNYPNLSKRFQTALRLSDEGGFDDCGHADCVAYDTLLQIAAYGELTTA